MTPEEIKTWRKATQRTQQQAADYLGVTLRQYQRFETGTTEIKATYARLVEADPKRASG